MNKYGENDLPARNDLGGRLEWAMEQKGITVRMAAEACGVREETVSRWRNGAYKPKVAHIATLARLLDVSVNWLLRGQN